MRILRSIALPIVALSALIGMVSIYALYRINLSTAEDSLRSQEILRARSIATVVQANVDAEAMHARARGDYRRGCRVRQPGCWAREQSRRARLCACALDECAF